MNLRHSTIPFRVFHPILAGATAKDRLLACFGAAAGLAITSAVCASMGVNRVHLVAPMGASAVLIFAVPASPLAQPWAVVGGNMLSALVGVLVVRIVPDPSVAAGVAVAAAIAAMSLARCLHPPGGAAALLAVLADPASPSTGVAFALAPVGLNAVLLTLMGLIYHRLISGHSYPHRPVPVAGHALPPAAQPGFDREDMEAALAQLGETFDVGREDLDLLLRLTEQHAQTRRATSAEHRAP